MLVLRNTLVLLFFAATGLAQTTPSPLPAPIRPDSMPLPAVDSYQLMDLEQMALRNAPSLARLASQVEAARARAFQATLRPNPQVGYLGAEIGNAGRQGQQGAFVSQEIVRGNKLALGSNVFHTEAQRLEQLLLAQQQRVLTDVRIAYFGVLVAQRRTEISQELQDLTRKSARLTNQLQQALEVSKPNALQAEIEAEQARFQRIRAEQQLVANWRQLATVIGAPQMPQRPLMGSLDQLPPHRDWASTVQQVLSQHPQVAAAAASVEQAHARLAFAVAQAVPNWTTEFAVQYDTTNEDPFATLLFSTPLQVFNRNQGNIAAARQELAAAVTQQKQVELRLTARLAAIFRQYESARSLAEIQSTSIQPKARQSLELVQQAYEAREAPYIDLLTTQRTFLQASLSYVNAIEDLWTNEQLIAGMLLSGSLQQ